MWADEHGYCHAIKRDLSWDPANVCAFDPKTDRGLIRVSGVCGHPERVATPIVAQERPLYFRLLYKGSKTISIHVTLLSQEEIVGLRTIRQLRTRLPSWPAPNTLHSTTMRDETAGGFHHLGGVEMPLS